MLFSSLFTDKVEAHNGGKLMCTQMETEREKQKERNESGEVEE